MLIDLELQWQVVGITGFVLTKLDGSARGGCVVQFYFFAHLLFFGSVQIFDYNVQVITLVIYLAFYNF